MAFHQPVYVETKTVPDGTTCETILEWWSTSEEALTARDAVRENSVCIIQLGGASSIVVCVPDSSSISGVSASVQATSKPRGVVGTATLLLYN